MAFEVIGVQSEKVQLSNYSRPDKESVFIPYTTAGQLWNTEYLEHVRLPGGGLRRSTRGPTRQVKEMLGRRLRFNPADERALRMFGSAQPQKITAASCWPEAGARASSAC